MITAEWNDTNWKARFFTIWGGQAISLFGSRLVQFALIWWLTLETGSATVLAIASLIGLLPTVLLGPFAGALIDRWKRRQVMLVVDTARFGAVCAFIWILISYGPVCITTKFPIK